MAGHRAERTGGVPAGGRRVPDRRAWQDVPAVTGRYPAGQTSLAAPIPEADPVVARWRSVYDPSAAFGVPAHVTVLYPFLPIESVGPRVLDELRELVGAVEQFDVTFACCARFPTALYLVPEPAEPFRRLTLAVAARWPQTPPYGGRFAQVVPHLTVTDGAGPELVDAIEPAVAAKLPFTGRVSAVSLYGFDGRLWTERATLPLRPARPATP